jgi:hypothetical protein
MYVDYTKSFYIRFATGNDKSDYKSAEAIESDAADNKKKPRQGVRGEKTKKRKKNRNN